MLKTGIYVLSPQASEQAYGITYKQGIPTPIYTDVGGDQRHSPSDAAALQFPRVQADP